MKRFDEPSRYKPFRVQYRLLNDTHNCMYFDTFEEARARYMGWQLKQSLETDAIAVVMLERKGRDGKYSVIFDSHTYWPEY